MELLEILVIIFAVIVVSLVFGSAIYKKIKGIPLDSECAKCHSKKNVNKMLDNIRRELDEEKANCHCH